MKIGMISPSAGFVGGLEQHVWDLSLALRERGHHLTLVHGAARGRSPERYARAFDRVVAASDRAAARGLDLGYFHRAQRVEDLAAFSGLPLAIAVHDHALTCVSSYRYLPVSQAPCHRAPGIACVAHGCCVVRDRDPSTRWPLRIGDPFLLRRRLLALAERGILVANSRYTAAHLSQAGVSPERIRVIHPLPPETPEPVRERPRAPRLIVIGQLLPSKGIDLAVDALALLPHDTFLDVVGDGALRAALVGRAAQVAPGRVRFSGFVDAATVRSLLDACSVALVPSRWPEPFGLVGIEAMRRGRPVAGAAHGGIPEWLEHGISGQLFAPGSVEGLAEAVLSLLRDRDAGARALTHARERFPAARMAVEIEALLASLGGAQIPPTPMLEEARSA
jgi:glycosyltransferase involved in cell wall biosynthesis